MENLCGFNAAQTVLFDGETPMQYANLLGWIVLNCFCSKIEKEVMHIERAANTKMCLSYRLMLH